MSQNEVPGGERRRAIESAPKFLIHNEGDSVAVAVQDVVAGASEAVYMDSDRAVTIQATEAIPLGHKVALIEIGEGVDVIEYGVRIGLTRQSIKAGQLVHIHNLRSARWQKSI
ncbi:MAG: UxaA family hydrolase [Ktedonobacteraceae bacterium]